jgi:uncharacterized protein with FMN-binding domain
MTRVLLAITGTVVGLVALLSFKTHPVNAGSLHGLPAAGLPASSSTAGAATTTAAPPNPTATGSSPAATPTSTTAAATAPRTIDGQAIDTRYGTVQVRVVVAGTKIQNVSFLQLTAFDQRSQDINSQAGPMLLQETLTAQSSQIDNISGATYTSDGYLQSLQSALDQAGIK